MKKAGTKLYQPLPFDTESTKLGAGKCSAEKPGWLNGAHPDESGETVTRQYCFNWARNGTELNDCDATTDIKITKCNDFYVYLLNKLNDELSCTYRYCTDD